MRVLTIKRLGEDVFPVGFHDHDGKPHKMSMTRYEVTYRAWRWGKTRTVRGYLPSGGWCDRDGRGVSDFVSEAIHEAILREHEIARWVKHHAHLFNESPTKASVE